MADELCECGHRKSDHKRPTGPGRIGCSGQKLLDHSGAITEELILCECKDFRLERDTYRFQRARITRICNELAPGKKVEFDETTSFIKFRIRDEALLINLTEPSGEWQPSVLGDKADDELRQFIKGLSNGKIR
jgi:hypothetical protein